VNQPGGARSTGSVAVVTGASAGVGRATARAFAARGYALGLVARGREGLDAAVGEARAAGVPAVGVDADVADPDAVEDAASRVEAELGPIDVWVNDAMVSVFGRFWEIAPQDFKRVTEVTYLGYVNGTRAALARMRPRDRGVIVQVGSALAYRGIPLQSAYCGAKHAIQGFCDSLRSELIDEGSAVRIVEVHLPALNTPQFDWVKTLLPRRAQPVAPIYQPEVAARAIVWAAEHPRREVRVGGSTWATIAADKLAPGFLDRYLGRTGVDSQQTDEPEDADRPDNLWAPVEEDRGAHGRFDERAHSRSLQLWLTTHRAAVAAALASVMVALVAAATADRRR
jgi:NAD(P)-dependent dehydrogenase (short-subunit alcohol dehydrogenase family)